MQVLYNILSNSVKYTFNGEITIILSSHNNVLTTQIADTGIGMTEEKQQHIYKMFSNNTNADITGIGIGLYLSKKLLDFLHGDLYLVSQINKGTDIMFWMPIKCAENVMDSLMPQNEPISCIFPVELSTSSINKAVLTENRFGILIVDDNPMCLSVLKTLLSKIGNFKVYSAYNGKQAIDLYKEKNCLIKLVLMDINMPVLNGIDSCKEMLSLQKQNNWQSIQVIAVSAQDDFFYISEAQKVGMNVYLRKPVSLNALQSVLDELKL
jgi:CheY-like chemotaxis protein